MLIEYAYLIFSGLPEDVVRHLDGLALQAVQVVEVAVVDGQGVVRLLHGDWPLWFL